MALYSLQKNFVWTYLNSTLENFKSKLLGYKTYKALLTQAGTNAPEATVLENSLGLNPSYAYNGAGDYSFLLNYAFFASPYETISGNIVEVSITPNSSTVAITGDDIQFLAYPFFFNEILIQSLNLSTPGLEDNLMGSFCSVTLEIKVYTK